eukprot:gene2230-437_t
MDFGRPAAHAPDVYRGQTGRIGNAIRFFEKDRATAKLWY